MSTYRELVGKKIKRVTSDPSDSIDGQMWYNSTSGTIRGLAVTEAWISQSPLNTGVYGSSSGGTADAYFVAGGNLSPPLGGVTNKNEQYNGSGFSEEGNLTTARMYSAGTGTVTAGLVTGGDQLPSPRYSVLVEEWNGTSWSEQNDIPQNKNMGAAGPQTAAMIFGGSTPSATSDTRFYDGTDWTSGTALNTARIGLRGGGNQTAAIAMGGDSSAAVEEYNGSSWTSVTSLPANRSYFSGTGPQTNALAAGGYSGSGAMNTTFRYNGSSWTAAPNLGTARYYVNNGPVGTGSNTWAAGGGVSPLATTTTEEFNSTTNVITAAAFSSGGNLGTARNGLFGVGATQATGLVFGGGDPDRAFTEEYDGTSWTESGDLNTARRGLGGFGIQTAAVAVGGITSSAVTNAEHYDGSSWTNATALPTASNEIRCGAGTQTAGLSAGGRTGPSSFLNATYHYDGSNWTAGGPLTAGRGGIAGGNNATQTAAIAFGGYTGTPQNPVSPATAEEYNGSSWTNGGTMITAVAYTGGIGTQTVALSAGGATTSPFGGATTICQGYDGTSWSTRPSMATARGATGTGGTASLAFVAGGYTNTASVNNTEEFTGETTTANVKNFTTS